MKFWVKKIFHGRNKIALFKKVLRKKSFRYLREAVFLIRHPFNIDLVEIGQVGEPLLIDIGAFDGKFATKFRSKYEDSKIVLFEPVRRFSDQIPSELRNCFNSDNTKRPHKGRETITTFCIRCGHF